MFNRQKTHQRMLASLTASLLVLSFLALPKSTLAADSSLKIAPYVKSEVTTSQDGSMSGKWIAEIPMGKVMGAALKAKGMSNFPNQGYPHGKDGKNQIAYVEYNVQFPDETTISADKIQMENTCTMFNKGAFTKNVSGTKVQLKFPFCDEDWANLGQKYTNDGGENSDKTIKVEIPYTISADKTQQASDKQITSNGDFTFYVSGTMAAFGMGATVFRSDLATVSATKAEQAQTKADKLPSLPTDEISLGGDLLANNDSQANAVLTLHKDDEISVTGLLQVKSIKDLMTAINQSYHNGNINPTEITIKNAKTTFTATLTLPAELNFPTDVSKETVEFAGHNDKFEVSEVKVEGQKLTVTMINKNQLNTFADVKDTVLGADDALKITVKGIKFNAQAQVDTNYTIKGTVSGNFSAEATYNASKQKFNFQWAGKQIANGKDSEASDANDISLTVKYVNDDEPIRITPTPDETEPNTIDLVTPKPAKPFTVAKTGELANNSLALLLAMTVGVLVASKRK